MLVIFSLFRYMLFRHTDRLHMFEFKNFSSELRICTNSVNLSRNIRKRTFVHVRQGKIQINLHVGAVWSESSLGAFCIAKDAKFLHADNEDSNQTARMRSLIWVFVFRKCQWVHLLTLRLFLLLYCITMRYAYVRMRWSHLQMK